MPIYTRLLTLLTTLLLAIGGISPRISSAEPPSLETPATPIATVQSAGVYIEGRVSERFGNSFILEDDSGRLLVDTWPEDNPALTLEAGDLVGVFGRPEGQRIQARWLVIDNALTEVDEPRATTTMGNRLNRSDPVAAPSLGQHTDGDAFFIQRAQAAGYQPLGSVEYKPRHVELRAINPYGETVELHIEFSGDIYKERHRE
ncbi:hypothetical protein LCGC14_0072880 [marine sediment metagenome]|uniref:OB domain-containing protein n=1 Tax=marine sediment metagenome TaxID=412755 RepID=A0A0F9W077_9ZZZZ|nr:hypothetical protein [Halomonas sp.]HDZ48943.1 hypothetical protein [Halomonas sp.]HEB06321.1 hypothetical protein [Halomonas sp.]